MADPLSAPFPVSPSFEALGRMLAAGFPEDADEVLDRALQDLERERRLDQAWLLLRQARPDPARWGGFMARVKARVNQGRGLRMNLSATDPDRITLRLQFELRTPACVHNPAALLGVLTGALLAAGFPVALGPDKSLRPAIHLGHPLPPMVEGRGEWADVALTEGTRATERELADRINEHAPPGLRILQCRQVPNHGSPVADLCRQAQWRWTCPAPALEAARERVEAFLASPVFEVGRTGKIGGQKGAKRVDIRPLLEDCRWEGAELRFRTRLAPGEATNPRKLLSAILGLEIPPDGLARLSVDLGEDPRLAEPGKFEPRLRNIYEDAVLLESGGSIRILEDDDDEPVVLG
ncbi:MAG: TIGR03936 family radical SAM-associated protein [Holophaga sp.]|jgi:radical SAM-linked protein